MNKPDGMTVGIAGLIFILVALFTPVGAAFLTVIGIVAYLTLKLSEPRS